MRALIVQRIRDEQWAAAAAAGVSVRTTYKWLRRHRIGGRPALEDASSRPHRQPRRTSADTVAAIVAGRQERRTAWAIATRLQIPRSTVAAVLVRAGLSRLAHLTPRGPVIRYERTRPANSCLSTSTRASVLISIDPAQRSSDARRSRRRGHRDTGPRPSRRLASPQRGSCESIRATPETPVSDRTRFNGLTQFERRRACVRS
jgi:hypothetical protein